MMSNNKSSRILPNLIVLTVILSSCGASTTTPNPPDYSIHTTMWNWVKSEGGFIGQVQTPDSVHYHQFYVLRSDSSLSFVRTPDLGSASWNGAYQIWRDLYALSQDTQTMIRFYIPHGIEPGGTIARLQYRGADTILIGDDAADGILETYARAR